MKVGIIGASGYTGAELMRILHGHPHVEMSYLSAHTYAGTRVSDLYPHLHALGGSSFEEFDAEKAIRMAGFHFVALPHGKAMEVVPALLEGGARVVDLSADYRLRDAALYETWYGTAHTSPHLLEEAVYGLPELAASEIAAARLVAVPGCYPTAALLALAPLAARGYDLEGTVIDAKSGVSGAGRSLSLAAHFAQAEGSVKPYGVGSHRHTPEIEAVLSALAGGAVRVAFTPHLVPMSRGILATCYVRIAEPVTEREVEEAYREFYAGKPFVVLLDRGKFPETKCVTGSNYCHLGWHLDEARRVLTVATAIDNLVKGASGQAVQCMNVMLGYEERAGLEALGIFP